MCFVVKEVKYLILLTSNLLFYCLFLLIFVEYILKDFYLKDIFSSGWRDQQDMR